MRKEIQLSAPNLNIDIVDNLKDCIETGWVSTGGRFITEFEKKIADYVNTQDAVSTQSGTAALHLALKVLGVSQEDEVIVPALTFIAAINPVRYMGASPIFMDCDESICLDTDKLERFCREECYMEKGELHNRKTNKRIPVLIVVHIFGNMANMEKIMEIAKDYHIKVVEDATEALGSYINTGRFSGRFAGTIGDIGAYSFNANKIITTGGGGMMVSHNREYLNEARYLSLTAKNDSLFFVHDEVGYNYRMLNIQAALGVSQIDELEKFIEVKIRNYNEYKELLSNINGITLLPFVNGTRTNHWFYSLYINQQKICGSRDELMYHLIKEGIQCRPVWKLIHTQKPYLSYQSYEIEKAYDYENNILNLPCSSNLTHEDIEYVCNKIIEKIRV